MPISDLPPSRLIILHYQLNQIGMDYETKRFSIFQELSSIHSLSHVFSSHVWGKSGRKRRQCTASSCLEIWLNDKLCLHRLFTTKFVDCNGASQTSTKLIYKKRGFKLRFWQQCSNKTSVWLHRVWNLFTTFIFISYHNIFCLGYDIQRWWMSMQPLQIYLLLSLP